MARVVVVGYGPPELFQRLNRVEWVPVASGVKNFGGISIARWLLTYPRDDGYPVKYRFTLEAGQDEVFEVEGYSVPTLLDEMRVSRCEVIRILNHQLNNYTENREDARYVLTVETIG